MSVFGKLEDLEIRLHSVQRQIYNLKPQLEDLKKMISYLELEEDLLQRCVDFEKTKEGG